jgi:hypothetical protein
MCCIQYHLLHITNMVSSHMTPQHKWCVHAQHFMQQLESWSLYIMEKLSYLHSQPSYLQIFIFPLPYNYKSSHVNVTSWSVEQNQSKLHKIPRRFLKFFTTSRQQTYYFLMNYTWNVPLNNSPCCNSHPQ